MLAATSSAYAARHLDPWWSPPAPASVTSGALRERLGVHCHRLAERRPRSLLSGRGPGNRIISCGSPAFVPSPTPTHRRLYRHPSEISITSNALRPSFPDGLDAEVFRFSFRGRLGAKPASRPNGARDVVHLPPARALPHRPPCPGTLTSPGYAGRWTVPDFQVVEAIYQALYPGQTGVHHGRHPRLPRPASGSRPVNADITRNEGYREVFGCRSHPRLAPEKRSSSATPVRKPCWSKRSAHHPAGLQTFSKSRTQYPSASPPTSSPTAGAAGSGDADGTNTSTSSTAGRHHPRLQRSPTSTRPSRLN